MKVLKRSLVGFLSAVLVVCNTLSLPAAVMAMPLAVPVVWELLQALLLSLGVTYLGYETYDRIVKTQAYEESVEQILDSLNSYHHGLGDDVAAELSASRIIDGRATLKVTPATMAGLREYAAGIAGSAAGGIDWGSVALPGGMDITGSYGEVLEDLFGAVPGSVYLRDNVGFKDGQDYDAYKSYAMERILQYQGGETLNYSIVYFVGHTMPLSEEGHWDFHTLERFIVMFPPAGVTVSEFRKVVGADMSVKVVPYDSDGNEITHAIMWSYYYFKSSTSSDFWTIDYPKFGNDYSQVLEEELFADSGKFVDMTNYKYDFQCVPIAINSSVSVPVTADVKAQLKTAVRRETYDVVTPGRTLTPEGALEGDVIISIPSTYDFTERLGKVIADELTATDVLEDIDVIPVDTELGRTITEDRTIAEAIDSMPAVSEVPDAGAGSVGGFDLSLADFFPFCIPFDFFDFVNVLKAPPQAPVFVFPMPVGYSPGGGVIYEEFSLDLSQFDSVAVVLRKFMLMLFIIYLILSTRRVFLRS